MPAPDLETLREILREMTEAEARWQRARAALTDADGEIIDDQYLAYDTAKGDHGWDLADLLPDWIARANTALNGQEQT